MPELNNIVFTVLIYAGSFAAGLLGALTGLGGGVVVVPLLTVVFNVDIHFAAGASLISVIATSSGATSAYVKEGFTNIRIGMFLEIATTIGAVIGAHLAGILSVKTISVVFAAILIYAAFSSFFRKVDGSGSRDINRYAELLRLNGQYPFQGRMKDYRVHNVPFGFAVSSLAGVISGLLGIGGGAIKVIAMDRIMKIPFKVSATTSNFMIGVTAVASAGIYLKNGYIHVPLVMPVMLGVLSGAFLGSRILTFSSSKKLKVVFSAIILVMAYEMLKTVFK